MDKASGVNGASANQAYSPHPTPALARESSSSSMRRQSSTQASQSTSMATSASASPLASSREASPARPTARSYTSYKAPIPQQTRSPSMTRQQQQQRQPPASAFTSTPASPSIRARRNSRPDPVPARIRTANSTPTSQRPVTLNITSTPALSPTTPDAATSRTPGPQKTDLNPQNSPRWPISPRIRSPPRLSCTSSSDAAPVPSDSELEELSLPSGMRTPVRGASGNVPTLETVQEASPLGPSAVVSATFGKVETGAASDVTPEVTEVSSIKTIRARQVASPSAIGAQDSGAENSSTSTSTKNNSSNTNNNTNTRRPPPLISRNSTVKVTTMGKGKAGESQPTTMTVETETVTSIPNVALGPSAAQGVNGSLRAKPSSETIRPKKDKRKSARKQPAVASGATTSKADIFEAKVASAVDEANTSDSEETFVYDSNPADARERPHRFHHSRTPSTTSLSQADRNGMRSIHSILEGAGPSGAGLTVKKSMKFVNTFGNTSGNDSGMGDDEASRTATMRGAAGSGRGTSRLHHHVGGRFGLGGSKNGHQSILDHESPFPTASRLKLLAGGGGGGGGGGSSSGGPTSPRPGGSFGVRNQGPFSAKKNGGYGSTGGPRFGYDMDDAARGSLDDERTPLIASSSLRGTMRGPTRGSRRHHMSLRALEQQAYHQHPPASLLNRFASCLVLTVMLMLVISGAIGFMFATSQPLDAIELVTISNVIASEQELMFDVMVRAHNPNVVVVTVDSADMEVFAKSPHAGTDSEWWRRPGAGEVGTLDAEADTTDNEPRDQPSTAPNFLLGKFTTFDNPLSFEGSFFHHGLSTSRSGVRIRRPGNGTDGGTERWERILEDEFDLIIKGVLRYSLPLSQRVRSALIEGRRTVTPNAVDDPVHEPAHNGTVV